MIAADQPTCFPSDLLVAVSSKDDGTMLNRIRGRHVAEVLDNRWRFCDQIGINYDDVVYHVISYDQGQTFDTIADATEADTTRHNSEGIFTDALYTEAVGVGLFLPVADCIATVKASGADVGAFRSAFDGGAVNVSGSSVFCRAR